MCSSILAWKIPWTEGTGSMGHRDSDMIEETHTHTHTHTVMGHIEVPLKAISMILMSNVIRFTLLGDYYGDGLEAGLDTTE